MKKEKAIKTLEKWFLIIIFWTLLMILTIIFIPYPYKIFILSIMGMITVIVLILKNNDYKKWYKEFYDYLDKIDKDDF